MPFKDKEKDKEMHKVYHKKWYLKNKDRFNKERKKKYEENKEVYLKKLKEHRHKNKELVLSYYSKGIPKCNRCGILDIDVLCIDHINGGGTKDRIDTRHWGSRLHFWLIKNKFPEGFQVLCANCNLKKYIVEGK